MPLIVVSGPEKAGKTTLCSVLRERHGAEVVHFGPVTSSYAFMGRLKDDVRRDDLVVWDRSWVCDAVYSFYFDRPICPFRNDWWLSHWTFGRAVQTAGTAVVLLGPSVKALREKRDATDLPIDPLEERLLYGKYADVNGILSNENKHDPGYAQQLADYLVERATDPWWPPLPRYVPPFYCGPRDARVVFVGDVRNALSLVPGVWLPFSTRSTTKYGRILDADAFRCGWTNTDGPLTPIDRADLVVACGATAQKFVKRFSDARNVLAVPHPSWLYRWGEADGRRKGVERDIVDAVRSTLALSN